MGNKTLWRTYFARPLALLYIEVPLHFYSFNSKRHLMRTNSNPDNRIVKNFLQSHVIEIHALMLSAWA